MIWQAFIDDSGHRGHSPVLVLAGGISPIARWADFVPHWQGMLDMLPAIKYFKMNEAARGRGQFRGWSEERRKERVALAYSTIENYVEFQVSCIIHLEPFFRIFTEETTEKRAINPFYIGFSAIISGVARHQRSLGLINKVDFIFDDQCMEKGKIMDAWDLFKQYASSDTKDFIGRAPIFQDDKEVVPIQAADLIAWWIRKMASMKSNKIEVPWKSTRRIPGFQFHYDENKLKEVHENVSRSLGQS
jgi:hypothetical protein